MFLNFKIYYYFCDIIFLSVGIKYLSKSVHNLLISLISSLLLVSYLPDALIIYFIIVFGQAHFLITYFYQNKANKINKSYIIRFLALLFLLSTVCFYVLYNKNSFQLLIFVTLIIFASHYFKDELKIQGFDKLKTRPFGIFAVISSFTSVFIVKTLHLDFFYAYPFIFLAIVLSPVFIFEILKTKNSNLMFLFFVLNVVLPIGFIFMDTVTGLKIAGFIILFHYIGWYLFYFEKFKNNDLNYYTNAVVLFNLLTILSFVLYSKFSLFSFLYVFFNPIFFYGWTILHILLTFKKSDFF